MNKVNYDKLMQEQIALAVKSGKNKLLLHACCAPCSSSCIERLKEYFDITVYFYNPNMDSEKEYNLRAEEQKRLCQIMQVDCVVEKYNKEEFLSVVTGLENKNGELSAIFLQNTKTQATSRFELDGMFIAIGQAPENEAFKNISALDSYGYIVSDENCLTDTEGVFVAGDCRTKRIRQVTTATADGAIAALAACRYIDGLSVK